MRQAQDLHFHHRIKTEASRRYEYRNGLAENWKCFYNAF